MFQFFVHNLQYPQTVLGLVRNTNWPSKEYQLKKITGVLTLGNLALLPGILPHCASDRHK
jgi:hypothetical protein